MAKTQLALAQKAGAITHFKENQMKRVKQDTRTPHDITNAIVDDLAQHVLDQIIELSGKKNRRVSVVDLRNIVGRVNASPRNKDRGDRSWHLGIALRRLEDLDFIYYDNSGARSFVKIKKHVRKG